LQLAEAAKLARRLRDRSRSGAARRRPGRTTRADPFVESKLSALDQRVIQLIVQRWENSSEGRETSLDLWRWRNRCFRE
jgi:hypothetical protein